MFGPASQRLPSQGGGPGGMSGGPRMTSESEPPPVEPPDPPEPVFAPSSRVPASLSVRVRPRGASGLQAANAATTRAHVADPKILLTSELMTAFIGRSTSQSKLDGNGTETRV